MEIYETYHNKNLKQICFQICCLHMFAIALHIQTYANVYILGSLFQAFCIYTLCLFVSAILVCNYFLSFVPLYYIHPFKFSVLTKQIKVVKQGQLCGFHFPNVIFGISLQLLWSLFAFSSGVGSWF